MAHHMPSNGMNELHKENVPADSKFIKTLVTGVPVKSGRPGSEREERKKRKSLSALSPQDANILKKRTKQQAKMIASHLQQAHEKAVLAHNRSVLEVKAPSSPKVTAPVPMRVPVEPERIVIAPATLSINNDEPGEDEKFQLRRDGEKRKMASIHERLSQMKTKQQLSRSAINVNHSNTSVSNIVPSRPSGSNAKFLAVKNAVKKGNYHAAAGKINLLETQCTSQDVVFRSAEFWLVKAYVHERLGDITTAYHAFLQGIEHNAQPIAVLKKKYARFMSKNSHAVATMHHELEAPSTPRRVQVDKDGSNDNDNDNDDDNDNDGNETKLMMCMTPAKALSKMMKTPDFRHSKTPVTKALQVVLDERKQHNGNNIRSPVSTRRHANTKTPVTSRLKMDISTPPLDLISRASEHQHSADGMVMSSPPKNNGSRNFVNLMNAFTPRKATSPEVRANPITPYSSALNRLIEKTEAKPMTLSRTPSVQFKTTSQMQQSLKKSLQSTEKHARFMRHLQESASKPRGGRRPATSQPAAHDDAAGHEEEEEEQTVELGSQTTRELTFGDDVAPAMEMDMDMEMDFDYFDEPAPSHVEPAAEEDEDVELKMTPALSAAMTPSKIPRMKQGIESSNMKYPANVVVLSPQRAKGHSARKVKTTMTFLSPVKRSTRKTPLKTLLSNSKKFSDKLTNHDNRFKFSSNPALGDVKLSFEVPIDNKDDDSCGGDNMMPPPPVLPVSEKKIEQVVDADGFAVPAQMAPPATRSSSRLGKATRTPTKATTKLDTPRPAAQRMKNGARRTPSKSALSSPALRRSTRNTPVKKLNGLATVTPYQTRTRSTKPQVPIFK